jgi:hypothetical protein
MYGISISVKDDIFKYNLGYCKTGIYSNMIIIPSYNEKGDLKAPYEIVLSKKRK